MIPLSSYPSFVHEKKTQTITNVFLFQVTYADEYEPYYVIHTAESPPYYEKLLNSFYDKSSHSWSVATCGYTFTVLPDVYLTHLPHTSSTPNQSYYYDYLNCAKAVFTHFKSGVLHSPAFGIKTMTGYYPCKYLFT